MSKAAAKHRQKVEAEHRQWMEAEIARLEKQGLSTEQIFDELDLHEARLHPALEFICQRLWKVPADRVDDAIKQAFVDLLRSNVPLDGDTMCRSHIADELERLYFRTPQQRRLIRGKSRRRARAMYLRTLIDWVAQSEGMSPAEAMVKIAEDGPDTFDAIQQALKPSRIAGKK